LFNLTKQEILVLGFLGLAAIFGIGVNFYAQNFHSLETSAFLKININKAGKDEFIELKGIGEVLAARIIKYRDSYGPFKKIEDIKRVYGISEDKFQQIKEYLTMD